ncbi:MAG TPA: hypothetical protein VM657_02065 [Sphingomonas sp.]|nr:hypothetical protein [Sphingomonas sp.]
MEAADIIMRMGPLILMIVGIAIGGWVLTTWMRIKNGYPLDGAWGQAVYPKKTSDETIERVKLLSQENAQLRAELGSMKDRLATVERIVTDSGHLLDQEIERLRGPAN